MLKRRPGPDGGVGGYQELHDNASGTEADRHFFERLRATWIAEGRGSQWTLVCRAATVGFFATLFDAEAFARRVLGNAPFLAGRPAPYRMLTPYGVGMALANPSGDSHQGQGAGPRPVQVPSADCTPADPIGCQADLDDRRSRH